MNDDLCCSEGVGDNSVELEMVEERVGDGVSVEHEMVDVGDNSVELEMGQVDIGLLQDLSGRSDLDLS